MCFFFLYYSGRSSYIVMCPFAFTPLTGGRLFRVFRDSGLFPIEVKCLDLHLRPVIYTIYPMYVDTMLC